MTLSQAIREVKRILVEAFASDSFGRYLLANLATLVEAVPDIVTHNLDTVPALYSIVRPQGDYHHGLELLRLVKERGPGITTRCGLKLGLGEMLDEVLAGEPGPGPKERAEAALKRADELR